MATIDLATDGTVGLASVLGNNKVYQLHRYVDLAEALDTKGSAFASGDTIQAINVPANTVIHGVFANVLAAGENTGATYDVEGPTTWVTASELDATGITTDIPLFSSTGTVVLSATDTIDVTIHGLTGATTLETGKIYVIAYVSDFNALPEATTVDRDVLA